jgi:DNA-binding MarR family transcriptional regulator
VTPSSLSEALRAFIREHIASVEQVEVLLLLYRSSPREWSAVAVGRELRIDPVSAARRLADFQDRGLISVGASEEALVYWYEDSFPASDRMIAELDREFRDRRTSIISLIFSNPSDDLRAFADAFRLRPRSKD